MCDAPADGAFVHRPDAVGVGDHDRAFDEAGFLYPCEAGHLAVAVQHVAAAENRLLQCLFAAGKDSGHAAAHGLVAGQVFHERREADGHAGDIGDRVEGAGCAIERNAEVARARRIVGKGHWRNEQRREKKKTHF